MLGHWRLQSVELTQLVAQVSKTQVTKVGGPMLTQVAYSIMITTNLQSPKDGLQKLAWMETLKRISGKELIKGKSFFAKLFLNILSYRRITQHHELMLISDMCLAYRNDEEYYKCLHAHEENSIENIHGWRQVQWECGVNLMYKTGKDLYPQDRNCCPWTKHILL